MEIKYNRKVLKDVIKLWKFQLLDVFDLPAGTYTVCDSPTANSCCMLYIMLVRIIQKKNKKKTPKTVEFVLQNKQTIITSTMR